MVRRVLSIVYKEISGLHQAAYVLAVFAFGSQLLALLRDRLLAHHFGAGAALDTYYAAFRIPDLLYVVFASTLSVYVLIPFVSSYEEQQDVRAAKRLLSQVFSLFLVVYTVVALSAMITAPYWAKLFFPGIDDMSTFVLLIRILLLQPLFLGVSSLCGVVTQIGRHFVLYAISPLLYNIGIIGGILFLYPIFGLPGLGIGVVLGAVAHFAVQLPLLAESKLSFGLNPRIFSKEVRQVLRTSLPRALTLSISQIILLSLVSLASVMTTGSVAVFQFAYNLQSVPLAVIGVSYSVAAFPALAKLYANNNMETFRFHIITAMRHIIFWSVPAIALVVVLRAQIVRVVLGSGAFDWSDTRLTAAVLAVLVVSLVAQAVNLLIIRAFYAGGYTRIPLYISLFAALLAVSASVTTVQYYAAHPYLQEWLVQSLRLSNVAGSEVIAIAFGFVFATVIQSFLLLGAATWVYKLQSSILTLHVFRSLWAGLVGGFCAYVALNFFSTGVNGTSSVGILTQGFLAGVLGLIGVIVAYYVARSPELKEAYDAFHRRFGKAPLVAPSEEVM